MAEQEQADKPKKTFSTNDLKSDDKASFDFFNTRKRELLYTRKDHYGVNLEQIWDEADTNYVPHRLGTAGKKVLAEDETKGWRGASQIVQLGSNNWQSDVAQANPFIKIQTALSILIDQNPTGVFTPTTKKFQATTELIKQLYQRSWEYARSKSQLVLFVFNLAKYGWAIARTYPLKVTRKVKVLKTYNPDSPEESVYEEKEVDEYNDIFRENIDPRNAWIDDMAKPNNPYSIKDWMWRKVYDWDIFEEEFGKYKNFKYVLKGGNTQETIEGSNTASSKYQEYKSKNLVEVFFYENRVKDLFMVVANEVPVLIEPLPISDAKGHKKLSCWQTFWMLRHAESPYGIGMYEAMRYDTALKDRFRNMTIDQVTLMIYKMFFYQGTQALTETGDITIAPGIGKQVLDPKNVNWLEVPGPGQEAFQVMEMLQKDIDNASAITETLLGEVTGKTAFEIAQAKESALKRLKAPLENIQEALNTEGYITVSLIQLLYSIPETYAIADKDLIGDYLKEIQSDPELYERSDTGEVDEFGEPVSQFTAKVFPEFPLNLDKDEKGNLIETKDTQFFRVKPKYLQWEGIITIKSQSLLTPSKQLDKALNLEFSQAMIPLLAQIEQERMMAMQMGQPTTLDNLPHGKLAKSICKDYDKDPRDVLPDSWLDDQGEEEQPLIVPIEQAQQQMGMPGQMPAMGQSAVPASVAMQSQPQSLVGKLMSKISAPFRKI